MLRRVTQLATTRYDIEEKLQDYRLLADFLGEALGPGFEIVVQDVTVGHCQIDHIAGDDSVTKRKEGAPLTDLGMGIVRSGAWESKDYLCGYVGKTDDGRILYSSTYFIKDGKRLIGMLCINEDRSAYAQLSSSLSTLRGNCARPIYQMLGVTRDKLLTNPAPLEVGEGSKGYAEQPGQDIQEGNDAMVDQHELAERFYSSQEDLIDDVITQLFPHGAHKPFSPSERASIVSILDEMGAFMIKGTVQLLAQRLECSIPSIYRYRQQSRSTQ
jgi:predicted transcriptional regulator YheO